MRLPYAQNSYWLDASERGSFKPLQTNIQVDVAIIGGGITGLTVAYLLKQSGLTVAVIEKNTIASGTTGGTTGKVTSQHSIIYAELQKRFGTKAARLYGEANQNAIEQIEEIVKKEKIDCDWRRADNYIYTTDKRKVKTFKQEARVAKSLGLPASYKRRLALPFKVKGAVKFSNQAMFNASKYTRALARVVNGQGSYVYEQSNVKVIKDGEPAKIKTRTGTVTAKDIIVATKVPAWPLIARFTYAALEYPHTSYVVAGTYAGKLEGMYISPDKGHYSILPIKEDGKKLLLIGGENHIPGLGIPRKRHQKLADYSKKYFGIQAISYRWKAMDYLAYDHMPLVGKVYPWSKHLYTATGFKKWGLTNSMVAATILHDTILGRSNPLTNIYTSTRFRPILYISIVFLQWLNKLRSAALVFGTALAAAGIAGFIPLLSPTNEQGMSELLGLFVVDTVHNFIHLGSGLLALVSTRNSLYTRLFFIVFGLIYGLVTLVGFIQDTTVLELFNINQADNYLHLVIAASSLWCGVKLKR